MFYSEISVLLFSSFAALGLYLYQRSLSSHRFPPGPRPLPVLGNIFDIPLSREYESYAKLAKVYGDVVHVTALGRHIVVLHSIHAAKELLDVRSAIYSDRPSIPMVHEPSLMDVKWSFVFQQYTATWRRQRRLFTHHLNPFVSQVFFEAQTSSAHTLLRSLLRSPEQFTSHVRQVATETIMAIAYGFKVKTGDPLVALADRTVKNVADGASFSLFLVNSFPWLRHVPVWVPGASFKIFAAEARKSSQAMLDLPFEEATRRIAEGSALPSFVASVLANPSVDDLIVSDLKAVAATMYGGASDTSVSTVQSCILGLVLNPSTQKRAQAELDAALGPVTATTFRLPTFADRKFCPYIDAIIKESLRWLPVAPMGVPHAASEDDIYRGWRIPKGTVVMVNSWAILHDEETYPDPHIFRPERFLGENPAPHPGERGCFGFGRRECPGRILAENSMWIQIASLLAAFTLSPAKDKDDRDIDISYASDPPPGFLIFPQPFPCTITPRSKEAELRIRETHPDGDWLL